MSTLLHTSEPKPQTLSRVAETSSDVGGTLVADVIALMKPRIVVLSGVATLAGALLAGGTLSSIPMLTAIIGVCLTVASACSLNMFLERKSDALMERTAARPLPAGRLQPWVALLIGLTTGVGGIALMAVYTNVWATGLAALAVASYVLLYTPMKTRSVHSLFVGAVPGALPPLIGWTALSGELQLEGLALFGVMYMWQVPHVLAISIYLRKDYETAGIKVVASQAGEERTITLTFVTTIALLGVSILPLFLHQGLGVVYAAGAGILGAWLLYLAFSGLKTDKRDAWAKQFFFATLIYITLLFGSLMVDALALG